MVLWNTLLTHSCRLFGILRNFLHWLLLRKKVLDLVALPDNLLWPLGDKQISFNNLHKTLQGPWSFHVITGWVISGGFELPTVFVITQH